MMNKHTITTRAAVQRLRCALKVQGKDIRATRGRGGGTYYIVDLKSDSVTLTDVDIESMSRALGALRPHESVGC